MHRLGRRHPDRLGATTVEIVDHLAQLRETVLLAHAQRHDHREVIDARNRRIDGVHRRVGEQREHERAPDEFVAETDGAHARVHGDGARQRAERVAHVHEQRVRAHLGGVAPEAEDHGDRAQGPHHAARPDRVTDRLADAVPRRNLEVVPHAFEATDRERTHHELGAAQRLLAVSLATHRELDVALLRDLLPIAHHLRDLAHVEVVENHLGILERGGVGDVGQQPRGPVVTPAADHGDTRAHGRIITPRVSRPPDRGREPGPPPRRGSAHRASSGCSTRAHWRSSR